MKYINKLYCLISGLLLLFINFSCNDSFLERQPLDKLSEEDVWKDANLMQAFVNNTYAKMVNGFNNDYWPMCLCDEAYRRGRATYHTINQGQLTPVNMVPLNYWKLYYTTITDCNIFLEKASNGKYGSSQSLVDRMVGEMKFLRAYSYMRLIALHGGVPLITKPFGFQDDFLLERNTYNECVDFIVKELDEAADLLPLSYTGSDIGRATKGAALAIKSRTLLYAASPLYNDNGDKSKWEKAAAAAKAVIELNIYSLYPQYKDIFLKPYNSEVIWDRPYNNQIKVEHSLEQWFYPNGSGGYGQCHPTHNATEFFEMKSGLLPKDDPNFDPQNPYVDRDPRFYDCILYDGAPWQGREIETFLPGGADSNEGNEGWNASLTGYYPRKFVDESIIKPTASNTGSSHWIYTRYGEILLNYAEAMFYLGNEEECRKYLNMIRDRESVKMPHITDSGLKLEQRIRNERYVELFFEEHRFFDVRRWKVAMETDNKPAYKVNILKDPVTGKKTYEYVSFQERIFYEQNYFVPIPQSEIDKNPKLKQNPNY